MYRLRVEGADGQHEELVVQPHHTVRVGRSPRPENRRGPEADDQGLDLLRVRWDGAISRNHAELRWSPEGVEVRKLDGAANPVFHRGQSRDRFLLTPGEKFVIGSSTFELRREGEDDDSVGSVDERTPIQTIGFTLADLRKTRYRDADARLEVLASLPHVIRGAASDEDLFRRLTLLLIEAVPMAARVAIVRVAETEGEKDPRIETCHWDGRTTSGPRFRPSRRLVLDAVVHRRQSVQCLWREESEGEGEGMDYTLTQEDLDWAFCTPVPGEACAGWGLYLTGRFGGDPSRLDLRPDLKFTEMVADVLGALKDVAQLKQRESVLGQFFSPAALPALTGSEGQDALEPRQTRMTILFCDLRGFSREAEKARDDLLQLLERVGQALDVMTEAIHRHRGVVGDFQGDAALAFWGWPLEERDAAARACRAALDIRERFLEAANREGDPLAGFRCGIGIASGEAVAGRLGSSGRFKIDVFGPVVNLASRLEGITKQLRVPILVDGESVDEVLRDGTPDWGRFRRLACLRPYGLDEALFVSEVLPAAPEGEEPPGVLTDGDLETYDQALTAFSAGEWEAALERLHRLPHWDQGKDFLLSFILRHQRRAPAGWDGVIPLERK